MDKSLGKFKDNLINVDYEMSIVESAKSLADSLKNTLKKLKVNFAKYNSERGSELVKNPPIEIYEYQNFFILEKTNGDTVLLDGFRRLLWYNAPDTPILVRKYKESDLKSTDILTLLVNLNHFKFFSDSEYHDRGFALLLKTVFEVDITTFKDTFDAYLSSDRIKNDYSYGSGWGGEEKIELIKDRIINPFFLPDIKFLEGLSKTKYMCDQYVGAMVYKNRKKSKNEFELKKFIALADAHGVLQELTVKYEKIGTDRSAKSMDVVNKIMEIYQNLFTVMEGGKVEVSFAEKLKDAKDMVAKLKKDKTLTKLTGSHNTHIIERAMLQYLKNKKPLEFVCVVHPKEYGSYWRAEEIKDRVLEYGIRNDIKFTGMVEGKNRMSKEMSFGVTDKKCGKFDIRHNYGGYFSYGKKYTKLSSYEGIPSIEMDIDLFVKLSESEINELNKTTE